ncbi:hypothetical protein Tco_0592522 [Tanacetum coccineum]
MASNGSDQDAKYALSKLLQRRTVAEYESEFLMHIKRVTGISESLRKSFYISGLKPLLQWKKLNIEEKIDIVLSWPTEKAPPVIEGSLYAKVYNLDTRGSSVKIVSIDVYRNISPYRKRQR